MERSGEITSLILNVLTIQKKSMSIVEIAELTGVHRNVLAKYIKVLEGQGKIEVTRIGTKKYIQLSQRIPASFLKILTTHPYLIIDKHFSILEAGNNIPELYHSENFIIDNATIQKELDRLFITDETKKYLNLAIKGKKSTYKLEIINKPFPYYYQLTIIPIVLDNGRPGSGVIIENISESEQNLNILKQIRSAYQELLDSQIQYVVRFDIDNTITTSNSTFTQHTGIQEQALIGSQFIPSFPKDSFDYAITQLSSITKEKPTISLDVKRLIANGDYSWERWKIQGVFDEKSNSPYEYSAVGLDITELKRSELEYQHLQEHFESLIKERTTELRELNSELLHEIYRRETVERELTVTKFVMDSAKDYIFLLNSDGDIEYMNTKAQEILALSENEVINIRSIISNDSSSGIQNPFSFSLHEIVNLGIPTIKGSIKRSDKEKIPIEITINKIVDRGKDVFCCIARDITDRKKIETDLYHYRKHLEQIIDERTKRLQKEIEDKKRVEKTLKNCNEHFKLFVDDSIEMVLLYQIDSAKYLDSNSRANAFFTLNKNSLEKTISEKLSRINLDNGEKILDFFSSIISDIKPYEERIFNRMIFLEPDNAIDVVIRIKRIISNNNHYVRIGITDISSITAYKTDFHDQK